MPLPWVFIFLLLFFSFYCFYLYCSIYLFMSSYNLKIIKSVSSGFSW